MQMESNRQGTTDFSDWKDKPENPSKTLIFGCEKTLIWTAVTPLRQQESRDGQILLES